MNLETSYEIHYFLECCRMMQSLCAIKCYHSLEKYSSLKIILNSPKQCTLAIEYNRDAVRHNIFFNDIQTKCYDICEAHHFNCDCSCAYYEERKNDVFFHTFDPYLNKISHSFVIKSDRNFTVSVGVEFDISNNVETLKIDTHFTYSGTRNNPLHSEVEKLGVLSYPFEYQSTRRFFNKIENISIRDVLNYNTSLMEEENYYCNTTKFPLLTKEYNIPPPQRKVSLSKYFSLCWDKLHPLRLELAKWKRVLYRKIIEM